MAYLSKNCALFLAATLPLGRAYPNPVQEPELFKRDDFNWGAIGDSWGVSDL